MKEIDFSNMSIYKKIQYVKEAILKANLKKTGENKYAGFKYYELGDFTPTIIQLCNQVGLFTKVTFNDQEAKLIIVNSDKPDQKEEYTSPMRELVLKGCNQIQALGGVETYSRRYLYMSAFDIIENDMFDKTAGKEKKLKDRPQKNETLATSKQIEWLTKLYTKEEIKNALDGLGYNSPKELTIKEASDLISVKKEESK